MRHNACNGNGREQSQEIVGYFIFVTFTTYLESLLILIITVTEAISGTEDDWLLVRHDNNNNNYAIINY